MAYLNFVELQGSPVSVPADVAEVAKARSGFSALEWQVVAIAQNDRMASLERPGRLAIALGALFGGKQPGSPLADPQLEALRRMAVLAWHRGYAVPRAEIRAFHDAGFTAEQYETLLASISVSRSRTALERRKRH